MARVVTTRLYFLEAWQHSVVVSSSEP